MGIYHWYAGTLVHESDLERVGWGFFGMPMGWREEYARERFSDDDDVFQYAKTKHRPATWDVIHACADAREGPRKLRARAVREAGKRHGLHQGYIRPVHEEDELPGAVTFGGEVIDASPDGLATLDLLATYAYEGFRRYSVGFKAISPYLSPREREVLCWSAEGKSAWEISQILGVSEATIRDYQKSLRAKYHSSTMTRVVVIAALNRTFTTLPSLVRAA